MIINAARNFTLFGLLALGMLGCGKSNTGLEVEKKQEKSQEAKRVTIVIDWQPTAEYYGFFYAKSKGLYADAGYDVQIVYGKGAPSVAAEVASGAALIGTTTSDNITRWISKGAKFSAARAICTYNPAVVISLQSSGLNDLASLKGRRLGTNPESAVYAQLLLALSTNDLSTAGILEDPTIGWSGVPQLKSKDVDAILGYTTNAAVDLAQAGIPTNEVYLGDYGIQSYGLVLVAASKERLASARLNDSDIDAIFAATSNGYKEGALDSNIAFTVNALRDADPSLDQRKLRAAIQKISYLNSRIRYPLGSLDTWLESDGVSAMSRQSALDLYR